MRTLLDDGTPVDIRPIRPDDKQLIADGLRCLSEETIRRRFLAAKPRFTAAELRYLTEVDGENHVALVVLPVDGPERIVAVGRFVRLADRPDTAEFAIVVADPWQGKGLGKRLGTLLVEQARARGISRIAATVAADNVPAQRLLALITRGLDRGAVSHGVRDLVAELAA